MPEVVTVPDPSEPRDSDYQPPRIEKILTAEELEREVHYGGTPSRTLG